LISDRSQLGRKVTEERADLGADGGNRHYADHGNEPNEYTILNQSCTALVAAEAIDQLKQVNRKKLEHVRSFQESGAKRRILRRLAGERFLPVHESIDGAKARLKNFRKNNSFLSRSEAHPQQSGLIPQVEASLTHPTNISYRK
jgi:hypothetical protein